MFIKATTKGGIPVIINSQDISYIYDDPGWRVIHFRSKCAVKGNRFLEVSETYRELHDQLFPDVFDGVK